MQLVELAYPTDDFDRMADFYSSLLGIRACSSLRWHGDLYGWEYKDLHSPALFTISGRATPRKPYCPGCDRCRRCRSAACCQRDHGRDPPARLLLGALGLPARSRWSPDRINSSEYLICFHPRIKHLPSINFGRCQGTSCAVNIYGSGIIVAAPGIKTLIAA